MWPDIDIMSFGCYTGVDFICIWDVYLVLIGITVFMWRGWDIIGGFEIVIHDVLFAVDDNTGFLSVGLDDLGR